MFGFDCRVQPRAFLVAGLVPIALLALAIPGEARAAGFEVPENTTLSVARGGTGAVNKRDPSALYFNPALLPRARGFQLLINTNFVNLNSTFERDPLIYQHGNQTVVDEFEPASNQAGFFPAPFVTMSWDMGIEGFTLGLGAFGPSAYGTACYGNVTDDGCEPDGGSARNMIVGNDLIVAYLSLGAGYEFELAGGTLSMGLTAMAAHMQADFSTIIETDTAGSPWRETASSEALFTAKDLRAWAPTGVVGVAYARDGVRLAASYRPPIYWEATGEAVSEFPPRYSDLGARISDPAMTLRTWHAGSLRLGWGYEGGVHPGRADRPRLDLEFNVVWENWSIVDYFEVEVAGDIELVELADEEGTMPTLALNKIYQRKGYQDTMSLRMGASYGFLSWLTMHTGGYLETGAQPSSFTNPDFMSTERYAAGLGASFHIGKSIDLELAYLHVFSPQRRVSDGQIYNQIPLSGCKGPDYQDDACPAPGKPPGNPQNNGNWTASYQIASAGLTWQY